MAHCCKTHCEEERGIKSVYVRNKKKAHIIHFCSGRFLLAISLRDISPYLVAMLLSTMKFLSAIFLPCYFFSISFVVAPDQGCHACTRQRSHMYISTVTHQAIEKLRFSSIIQDIILSGHIKAKTSTTISSKAHLQFCYSIWLFYSTKQQP